MKFELSTENIVRAVRASVLETVNLKPGQEIQIEFTNGRGAKGVTATAEIVELDSLPKSEVEKVETTAGISPDANAGTASVERVNGKVVAKAAAPEDATPEAGNEGAGAEPASDTEVPTEGLFGKL